MKRALNKNDIKLMTLLLDVIEHNDLLCDVQDLYIHEHNATSTEFDYVYNSLSHKVKSAKGSMEAYVS